jgi:NitT/TauT family transport system permease protein
MEARLRSPLVSQFLRPPFLRLGPKATSVLMYGVSLLLFLGFWELMAVYFYSSVLFPTPVQTVQTFLRLAVTELPGDVAVSLGRVVTGFAIGGVVGAIIGLAMGSWAPIRSLFEPYVHFLRFIPPIAWFTPAVIWFGIGEESKVFLIVYTTTFVVLLNTLAGVEAVPTKRMLVARMFGATVLQSFAKITVPSSLPYILMGLRLASGNSFMTLVAAEMLGANRGIGFLIINARLWSATDQVFCGMFVLGCMGYGTDLLIRWCIRRWAWRYMPQHQNR